MDRFYHKKNYNQKRPRRNYYHNVNNYTSKIVDRNRIRRDSYSNAMSGFGGRFDPINRLTYNVSTVLSRSDCEMLYRFDWLSRKIIEVLPDDCLRKWIDIHIDDGDVLVKLNKKIKELKTVKKFKEAMINARLYKGSVIILGILNGQSPKEKLDYNNIEDVNFLNVIDANCIIPHSYYKNPFLPNYGEPELYKLNTRLKPDDYIESDNIIHESRLIRFDGAYLPEYTRATNHGWHDTVLNGINLSLKQYGTSIQAGALLFQDFISKTLKMPNLGELLMTEEGKTALELRLQYAIANFSSLGIILLGEHEEFNKIQTPITGLEKLMDKYFEIVSAASYVPRTRIFGQTLGTLAGATETTRAYYDYATAYQTDHVEDPLKKFIKILLNCKNSSTRGVEPSEWSFKFNSLWDETNKEITTARKMQAQVDEIYIDKKVLTPQEVTMSRFRRDGYSFDTIVNINERIGEFYEEINTNENIFNENKNINNKNNKNLNINKDINCVYDFEPPASGDAPDDIKNILNLVYSSCRTRWVKEHPDDKQNESNKQSCAKIAWYAVEQAGWFKNIKTNKWEKINSNLK